MDPRGDPSFRAHILDLLKELAGSDPAKFLAGDGTFKASSGGGSASRATFFDDFMAESPSSLGESTWRNFTANGGGAQAGGEPADVLGSPNVWGYVRLTTGVQANGQSGLSK